MVDANGDGMVMRAELKQYLEVSAALAQAALVLTVSDDAKTLFEILDADLDNRLNLRDFRNGAAEMHKFDHDQDERLATSDLRSKYGFTVTLARPEQFQDPGTMMRPQARQPRIRAMTAGPTWFRKMDRNQDGDLTWREFLGTRSDFDRIDADGSGLIDLNEAVGASAATAATSASQ
jgi:Ca2+-binding EF-hand superfamily protein